MIRIMYIINLYSFIMILDKSLRFIIFNYLSIDYKIMTILQNSFCNIVLIRSISLKNFCNLYILEIIIIIMLKKGLGYEIFLQFISLTYFLHHHFSLMLVQMCLRDRLHVLETEMRYVYETCVWKLKKLNMGN